MKLFISKNILKTLSILCFVCIIMNENTVLSVKVKDMGVLEDPLSSLPDLDEESLGFIQKAAAKKVVKVNDDFEEQPQNDRYRGAGFVDPTHFKINQISEAAYMKFKQYTNADEQFDNLHYQKNDRNSPASSRELLRQKDLSNGVLLVDLKRTANFETGQYLDFFYASQRLR